MLSINLLPWRETQRITHKKKYQLQLLCAIFVGTIVVLSWREILLLNIVQAKLQKQKTLQVLKQLQPQVSLLTQTQLNYQTLTQLAKLNQANTLTQLAFIKMLYTLGHETPAITITKLQKNATTILLQGTSKTSSALPQLIQKLSSLANISPPQMTANNFTITFQLP